MKQMSTSIKFSGMMGVFIILFVLAVLPAMAQLDDLSLVGINISGEGITETSTANNSADIGFQRGKVSVSLLTLNVEYARDHYTWSNVDKLPFGNGNDAPWDNFHSISVGGLYGGEISDKWSYLTLVGGTMAFEDGADQSYQSGLLAGGTQYTYSDTLNFLFGVGLLYSNAPDLGEIGELADDLPKVLPLPVLGVQWNQNAPSGFSASVIFPMEAKIQFISADQRFSSSIDAFSQQAEMAVHFLPMLGTTLRCTFDDSLAYRLSEDNVVLSTRSNKEAYLVNDRNFAELMLNMTLPGNLAINVGPYYAFDQTLSVLDRKSDEIEKIDMDNAFGAKFDISWSL